MDVSGYILVTSRFPCQTCTDQNLPSTNKNTAKRVIRDGTYELKYGANTGVGGEYSTGDTEVGSRVVLEPLIMRGLIGQKYKHQF